MKKEFKTNETGFTEIVEEKIELEKKEIKEEDKIPQKCVFVSDGVYKYIPFEDTK